MNTIPEGKMRKYKLLRFWASLLDSIGWAVLLFRQVRTPDGTTKSWHQVKTPDAQYMIDRTLVYLTL